MKMKRQSALLVLGALLLGLLPVGNATISEAATTPASTSGRTARVDYGLNNPTTGSDGVTTWDCVWFGNYWQEDTNGDGKADTNDAKQPIKWRVLSVNGDDAFLLADKSLDCRAYNDTLTDITWETCTMRSWLNGYGAASNKEGKDYSGNNFLNNAFSAGEQSAIRTTKVVNSDNSEYGTAGGNDTSDKVYLLSRDEVVTNPAYGFLSDYFLDDESRMANNTEYAKTQGVATGDEGTGRWWLRSLYDNYNASYVDEYGAAWPGFNVSVYDYAARPALHLNLSSASNWSYAGKVNSKGVEIGLVPPVPGTPEQPTEPAGTGPTENPVVTPAVKPTTGPGTPEQPTEPAGTGPTENPVVTPAVKPTTGPGTPEQPTEPAGAEIGEATPGPGTPEQPTEPADAEPTENPGITPTAKPTITQPGAVISLVPGSSTQATTPVTQPQTPPAASGVGKVESVKLTQKKQAATVSWKKIPGVAGYQVWYSTSKKWNGKKQKSVRENKVTVKNLKKKKTYYFRVRAYRLEGTKKVYGGWSKTKQITIKKASGGIMIL